MNEDGIIYLFNSLSFQCVIKRFEIDSYNVTLLHKVLVIIFINIDSKIVTSVTFMFF